VPKAIAEAVKKETFFAYDAETDNFRMVVGRLLDSKSKLGTLRWAETVFWDDGEVVDLQHYYRSLGVLSRCMPRIEENLFFQGKDLFTPSPDLLFFDTTSVYFEGEGPVGELGRYGFSKEKRPDRRQMIVGVVLTKDGTPLGHHVFPGNMPDATAFSVVIEEMRSRFGIKRVILVGDGMFNAKIVRGSRSWGWSTSPASGCARCRRPGDRARKPGPFETVTEISVKKVVGGKRYVVCLNEEEAKRAKAVREEVVAELRRRLPGTQKLVGHSRTEIRPVDKDAFRQRQKIIGEVRRQVRPAHQHGPLREGDRAGLQGAVAGGTGVPGDQVHLRDPAGLSVARGSCSGTRRDLLPGVLPADCL
jgi:hypothetical protein